MPKGYTVLNLFKSHTPWLAAQLQQQQNKHFDIKYMQQQVDFGYLNGVLTFQITN